MVLFLSIFPETFQIISSYEQIGKNINKKGRFITSPFFIYQFFELTVD